MTLPITPATTIRVTWDDSLLGANRSIEVRPSRSVDPADGRSYISTGRSTTEVMGSAPVQVFNAIDRVIETARFSTLDGVKNNVRSNTLRAGTGEVAVFIDNKGLADDLRYRGEYASAPQPIVDLLEAARGMHSVVRSNA